MSQGTDISAWSFKSTNATHKGRRLITVLLPDGFLDKLWMKQIAKDEKDAHVVFLRSTEDCFRVNDQIPNIPWQPSREDLEAVATMPCCRKLGRNPDGAIDFVMSDGTRRTVKGRSKGSGQVSKYPVFDRADLQSYIQTENSGRIEKVVEQLRSAPGVIPFVGAGMSASFEFPQWGEFLKDFAKGTTSNSTIGRMVDSGKYERAAEKLHGLLPHEFRSKIDEKFNRQVDSAKLQSGALSYLPDLASGPVITTNFDHVLEQTFKVAGREFTDIITGTQMDITTRAIQQNRPALLKIHGDCRESSFRVFTEQEYEQWYGGSTSDSNRVTIGKMGLLIFTNRPLFFLGCSLEQDRTVDVLRAVKKSLRALTHYGVFVAHYSIERLQDRKNISMD